MTLNKEYKADLIHYWLNGNISDNDIKFYINEEKRR